MPKNLKRNTQKLANEAKSCMKLPSRKITRLEHARRNIFKLLTNPVNQSCHEFVMLNKKAVFEKLDIKVFDKVVKKGFLFYCLNFIFQCL